MIGQLLAGHYRVLQKLGAGGFGQTYIAEDLHRPGNPRCVVKHLQPASNDPQVLEVARKLFNTEAETLEKLGNHRQIPRLLAYFEEDEHFFLVQDLIPGHTLSDELKPGQRWSESQVIALLQEVLEILTFVHNNQVIHRDIKPDNIIRDNVQNKLVLIDFGAIKQVRNQALTQRGQVSATVAVGTPGYMPSEQAGGTPRPNSDLYALGMIGIQALTGVMPFQLQEDPATGEIIWQHLATVSPGLRMVLEKMTRYHFRERYATVTEAKQALAQISSTIDSTVAIASPQGLISSPTIVNELTLEWYENGQPQRAVIREGQPSKNPGTIRLGRDPARCDLVFSDPSVSGLQAEIFFNSSTGRFLIRALRDSNPVRLNGQSFPQGEMVLQEGNHLQLGQTELNITRISPTAYQEGAIPSADFPSAPTVLNQPIPDTVPPPDTTPPPSPPTQQTQAVVPNRPLSQTDVAPGSKKSSNIPLIVGGVLLALIVGGLGGWGVMQWLSLQSTNPDPDPPPTPEECLALVVNGNVRRQPTSSFNNNIITTLTRRYVPVTGKQTEGGWFEVELADGNNGWAHHSVIRNVDRIPNCLEQADITIDYVDDIPRPPAKGEQFLNQAKRLARQGKWEAAIARAEKVPADSKLFDEAQDLIEEWEDNLFEPIEPPVSGDTLNQVFPEYIANAIDSDDAFADCPNNGTLELLGETNDFYFAVCEKNGELSHYLGKSKESNNQITVPWSNGFYNGKYLYDPPLYGLINSTDDQLQVYEQGDLIVNQTVTRLYEKP